MPFIHPAIFWTGLAAASIPLIIHLLNRRRFRVRDWAAMRFLIESVRRSRRKIRIEEIILLALRTLAIVLLAIAIGRFTGCSAMNVIPGSEKGSSSTVYVLDDSASMNQKAGSGNLFAAAVADLTDQLRKSPQGDKVAILLTSQAGASEAFLNPTFVEKTIIDSAVTRLQGLKPSDARVRLSDALISAGALLANDAGKSRQVVLISDCRKVDLSRSSGEAIRKAFADLRSQHINVVTIDYGRPARNNLTVESVELVNRFAVASQPIQVRVCVRNNGQQRVENVPIDVTLQYPSGSELAAIAVPSVAIDKIDPQEARSVQCQLTIPQAGPAVISAKAPPDELENDNIAYLSLEARPHVRVLVVDGSYDLANPNSGESWFFSYALDPSRDGGYGTRVETVSPESLGGVRLEDYDLVAMMNVASLTVGKNGNGGHASGAAPTMETSSSSSSGEDVKEPAPNSTVANGEGQLAALERYVAAGGGLMIFPGDDINLEFYGQTDKDATRGRFYNNGRGLLPLPLGGRVGEPSSYGKYYRLDPKSLANDDILGTLAAIALAGQDATRLIRFYAFSPAAEVGSLAVAADVKPPLVLARFNDPRNCPAVISKQFGKGSVVLFCSSASLAWNDWPGDEVGTYIATMNDACNAIARAQNGDLTGRVQQSLLMDVPPELRDAKATLKTPLYPQEEMVSLVARQVNAHSVLRYDRTSQSGVYRLGLEMPDKTVRDVLYSRNVEPAEGQLEPGRQQEISAAMGASEKDYIYIDRSGSTAAGATLASMNDTKEYWLWAMGAMLVLLAAETVLAQRFGHYS